MTKPFSKTTFFCDSLRLLSFFSVHLCQSSQLGVIQFLYCSFRLTSFHTTLLPEQSNLSVPFLASHVPATSFLAFSTCLCTQTDADKTKFSIYCKMIFTISLNKARFVILMTFVFVVTTMAIIPKPAPVRHLRQAKTEKVPAVAVRNGGVEVLVCPSACLDSVADLQFRMRRAYNRYGTFTETERECIASNMHQFCRRIPETECIQEEQLGDAILQTFSSCIVALSDNATEQDVENVYNGTDLTDSPNTPGSTRSWSSRSLKASKRHLKSSEKEASLFKKHGTNMESSRISAFTRFCQSGFHYCCSLAGDAQSVPCFLQFCQRFGYSFFCY